jgi:LacI family transcriptional regulator
VAASTLAEVAKLAGVSPATASRVLNGSARTPGPGIAERVRKAAESLGYVANAQAQALAKSSTGLIGLIVHDIADPYFSAIAQGVQAAARQERRMVLLATTDGTPAGEKEAVIAFAARRADAIVIAGSRTTRTEDSAANGELTTELERYCRNGGRLGVVGQGIIGMPEMPGYRTLPVPNQDLARKLARELAGSHDGPFMIVAGPAGLATSDERIHGFQAGLADAGRPAAEVLHTAFNRNGGYDAGAQLAARLKDGKDRPCIFAGNDVMAIGIAASLREHGFSVPEDAALAGFDDIEWLRDFRPELSTAGLPLEEIGRQVTLAALEDPEAMPDGGTSAGISGTSSIAGTVRLRRSTEAV